MSVYRRGKVWWFKFRFQGQQIRETAKTHSKTIAREAERARRRELELGINRISKRDRIPLFPVAAQEWLDGKINKSASTLRNYEQYVESLKTEFKDRLVSDIGLDEIRGLQRKRLKEGLGNRSVNYEVAVLRQILKSYRMWAWLSGDVEWLKENHNVGKALLPEHEERLLAVCAESRSPGLLPLLVLGLDAGLRASEAKSLRRCDLRVKWKDGLIVEGELSVPKSKTDAGTGRTIPFTKRLCSAFTLWLSRFEGAGLNAFVFPSHKVGFLGNKRSSMLYNVDLSKPMNEWKSAWYTALRDAKLSYRWHDLRHSFITRLLENPEISEETVRALAGHVSRKMMEHYSHIRQKAKRDAIVLLEKHSQTRAAQEQASDCLLYTSPSPRDLSTSRMPSSA